MRRQNWKTFWIVAASTILLYQCSPKHDNNSSSFRESSHQTVEQKPSEGQSKSLHLASYRRGEITQDEFDQALLALPFQKRLPHPNLSMEDWKRGILKELVAREVLWQEAQDQGLHQDPRFLQLMDQKKEDLLVQIFLDDYLGSSITVEEDELQEYYNSHPERFLVPEIATARHIFFNTTNLSAEDKEIKHALALDVLKQAQQGLDFRELVVQYSDSPVAEQGGFIGPISTTNQRIHPILVEAIFSLNPGQISDLVETRHGYEILKREQRIPARTIDYKDARDLIRDRLRAQKKYHRIQQVIEEQSYEGNFEYHPEYLVQESAPDDLVLLRVDDLLITLGDWRKRQTGTASKEQSQSLLEQVKNHHLLLRAARRTVDESQTDITDRLKEYGRNALARAVMLERVPSVEVSEEEIRREYEESAEDRERYSLLHEDVLLRTLVILEGTPNGETGLPRSRTQAKEKIHTLHSLLEAGTDFQELVALHSEDKNREEGGLLEYLPIEQLTRFPIEALQPGQYTQPVEIPGGFALLQMVERRRTPPESFESARSRLETQIRKEKFEKQVQLLVDRIAEENQISFQEEALMEDPFAKIRSSR